MREDPTHILLIAQEPFITDAEIERQAYDWAFTSVDQRGVPSDGAINKLAVKYGPAVVRGVATGLVNAADPVNALLAPVYKVKLIAELSAFVMQETLYWVRYTRLDPHSPEAKALYAQFSEPFQRLATVWTHLNDEEKVEMITQVATEIVAGGKIARVYHKFYAATFNLAERCGVAKNVVDMARKLAGIKPEQTPLAAGVVAKEAAVIKRTIAPGVLQDSNGVIEVANMHSFFDYVPFGKELKAKCRPLKKFYGNERIYEVTERIPGTSLNSGDILPISGSELRMMCPDSP